jgi:hypothetical protein
MVAHIDKLPPEKTHYIVRVFSEPVGPIDPETGQPWKEYDGYCVLSVLDGIAELQGIKTVPPGSFFLLRGDVARQLNLKEIYGYRWENGEKRRVTLTVRNVVDVQVQ